MKTTFVNDVFVFWHDIMDTYVIIVFENVDILSQKRVLRPLLQATMLTQIKNIPPSQLKEIIRNTQTCFLITPAVVMQGHNAYNITDEKICACIDFIYDQSWIVIKELLDAYANYGGKSA